MPGGPSGECRWSKSTAYRNGSMYTHGVNILPFARAKTLVDAVRILLGVYLGVGESPEAVEVQLDATDIPGLPRLRQG